MDVNSGSVHVVDELVYDAIAYMVDNQLEKAEQSVAYEALKEHFSDGDLSEIVEEIYELKEQGMLFTEDIYEKSIDAFKNRETVVKALCLHIAHDCNLKCKYCFAEEGEYHGRRALMSYEVGKKALDFLVANSGNRVNLEVDFFWRGAVNELAGCERACCVWQKSRGTTSQKIPLYTYDQRGFAKR